MDQQIAPIPVFRPPFLTDGGEFRGSLVEAPANVFYQQVKASRATLNRMQFQWRSVSDSLLLSPLVRLRFQLDITCPQMWTQLLSYASVSGILHQSGVGGNAPYAHDGQGGVGAASVRVPLIVFADGDAFTSCCSSMNLVFNGTSIALNRCNYFWRDYLKCMVASEDAARIYKSGGGAYDKYDQRPVVVQGRNEDGDQAGPKACGITQDSGINERSKALYALIHSADGDGIGGVAGFTRRVQISVPVPIPPFNPWRGYAMPASSPYTKTPLAIPHLSAGGLDFLLEDFATSFIRRLGSVVAGGAGAIANVATNNSTDPLAVALVDDQTHIELKYYRLSHTRALKESYRFNIWQAQTFLAKAPPSAAAGGWVNRGDQVIGLKVTGKDGRTAHAGATALSTFSYAPADGEIDIEFDTINLAQIPSYLLISVPKLNESYTHSADALGTQCVFNLSRNMSIKSLRIIVNSARGAIEKSADVDSGFIDAERLWEMTKENCNSKYFVDGGFRAWRDHNCAIMLSSSQFATGLMACDGVAYPVQIQIEMRVQNRSVDVSAEGSFLPGTAATAGDAGAAKAGICRLVPDIIRGQAQCTAFYTKVVLASTENAATTNSMNYPLSSAERLLNAQGRIR